MLNFKDVGKHQISCFLKEKKELLIHEIKTSVNVKKRELDRLVINEVSKYIGKSAESYEGKLKAMKVSLKLRK